MSASAKLVERVTGEYGREYWMVRHPDGYVTLHRRSLISASENDLTATEKIVELLAMEIERLTR